MDLKDRILYIHIYIQLWASHTIHVLAFNIERVPYLLTKAVFSSNALIAMGAYCGLQLPVPNCPSELRPNVYTWPGSTTTALWERPMWMSMTRCRASALTSVNSNWPSTSVCWRESKTSNWHKTASTPVHKQRYHSVALRNWYISKMRQHFRVQSIVQLSYLKQFLSLLSLINPSSTMEFSVWTNK